MQDEKELKLSQIQKDVTKIVKVGSAIVITNDEEMESATDFLGQIKGRLKRIEELRLTFTKPLNEALANINNEFRKSRTPLEQLETKIKSVMKDYYAIVEKKRQAEQAKIAKKQREEFEKQQAQRAKEIADSKLTKKAQKEEMKAIEQEEFVEKVVVEEKKTVKSDSGSSVTFKSVWKFKVVDITKVPAQFLKVDEVEVNKSIRMGVRGINGLELFEEKEVSARI